MQAYTKQALPCMHTINIARKQFRHVYTCNEIYYVSQCILHVHKCVCEWHKLLTSCSSFARSASNLVFHCRGWRSWSLPSNRRRRSTVLHEFVTDSGRSLSNVYKSASKPMMWLISDIIGHSFTWSKIMQTYIPSNLHTFFVAPPTKSTRDTKDCRNAAFLFLCFKSMAVTMQSVALPLSLIFLGKARERRRSRVGAHCCISS